MQLSEFTLVNMRGSGEATRCAKRRRKPEKKKRETARLARANELRASLTTQNKMADFWSIDNKLSTIKNHLQVDDDWSNAGKFVMFPEKKKH